MWTIPSNATLMSIGSLMYSTTTFNIKKLYVLSTQRICVLYGSPNVGPGGRSSAEIVVSNPTGGMDVCLL